MKIEIFVTIIYKSLNSVNLYDILIIYFPNFIGSKYKHFVKFQNLIDLSYIQLTTNQSIWPLLTRDKLQQGGTSQGECYDKYEHIAAETDVWVRFVCLIYRI